MLSRPLLRVRILYFVVLMVGLVVAGPATAQPFPSKPITLIVPFPAGGAVDIQARALALSAAKELGQPIVIVNRPGAAGSLGPLSVKAAPPDGYLLTMFGGNLFRLPYMQKVGYDALKDFTYVIRLVDFGFGITVPDNAPWKTLDELLAHAKSNPGMLSVGAIGPGASGHVGITQLAKAVGVRFNYIPYKGANEAQLAAASGQIDFAADTAFAPFVTAGKLRLLAIMNEVRFPKYGSVPTLKELGYNVVASGSVGIVGPRGMDDAVLKAIHNAFQKALNEPEFKRLVEQQDLTIRYLDSAAYTAFAAQEVAKEKGIVDELGLGIGK